MSGCALRRFNGHGAPDRPTNRVMWSENEKNLKELLALRAQQDMGIYGVNNTPHSPELDKYFTGNKDLLRSGDCGFCSNNNTENTTIQLQQQQQQQQLNAELKDDRTRWAIPSASIYKPENLTTLILRTNSTN